MKYVLMLNDMRFSNVENLIVVKTGDRQELIDFHNGLLVESYRDERWGKRFKKDSELEWCNPGTFEKDSEFFGGVYPIPEGKTEEEAMQQTLSKMSW